MTGSRSVRWALRCYPDWWRARYADEVLAVSEDLTAEGKPPLRIAAGLVGGAIVARTEARGLPRSSEMWGLRTRVSIATATLPLMVLAPLVVVAVAGQTLRSPAGPVIWSGFNIVPTHLQVIQRTPFALVPAPPLTPVGLLVSVSAFAMVALFLLALLVLFFGWSRLSGAIAGHAGDGRRRTQLLAWTPIFSILIDVALLVAIAWTHPSVWRSTGGRALHSTDGHPAVAHALTTALPFVAGTGWVVGAFCVALAARRAETEPGDLRYGRTVATIVTTLFALMTAATVAWGIGLVLQARQAAHGTFTVVAYGHPGYWLPLTCAFVVGAVLSVLGARAANRSWHVVSAGSD